VSRLFIQPYLDEDVSVLATLLRVRSFDVRTTLEAGNLGANDQEQLAYAAANDMAILTHNRVDFEKLANQWLADRKTHGGIIISVRRPPHEIVRRLLVIMNDVTAEEFQNQLDAESAQKSWRKLNGSALLPQLIAGVLFKDGMKIAA
jgi:hypothetical protein